VRGPASRTLGAAALCVAAVAACDPQSASGPRGAPATAAANRQGKAEGPLLVYEQTENGNQDLYVVPVSGGIARRLTDHPASDGLPRFTPDGRSVVYSSDRDGHFQLWQVPATGGEPRRLRKNAFTEWQADVSPDGRSLAYLSNEGGPEGLWRMDLASGSTRRLVLHGNRTIFGNPHWSPDGRRITFSSNWRVGHQIWVADATTGEAERISGVSEGGCEPRFHPDGKRVVYVRRGLMSEKSRLLEHDLETGEKRVLIDWPAMNYDPVYSPDGSEVAFASNITGEWVVYRQRLADGKSWRVSFGKGPARYPDYQPVRLRQTPTLR
jgi:Tol biopolymer transport system component